MPGSCASRAGKAGSWPLRATIRSQENRPQAVGRELKVDAERLLARLVEAHLEVYQVDPLQCRECGGPLSGSFGSWITSVPPKPIAL
jgi:hypothetical protein